MPLAVGTCVTLYGLGDRTWARNVKAAAWLRLTRAVTLLVGVAAFATHLYIEQDWIWLILALLVISGALIFWVQDLGNRIQHADGDSTLE